MQSGHAGRKDGGVNHVDCSTRVAAGLHVCRGVDTHSDHGRARGHSHANGHLSDNQHSFRQNHLLCTELVLLKSSCSQPRILNRVLLRSRPFLRPNSGSCLPERRRHSFLRTAHRVCPSSSWPSQGKICRSKNSTTMASISFGSGSSPCRGHLSPFPMAANNAKCRWI